jgi:HEAT repeat protein
MTGIRTKSKTLWIAALAAALTLGVPADSIAMPSALQQQEAAEHYERARQALNRAEYARAVELFRLYRQASPDGRWLPESLYWEGFALSRMEGTSNLRAALDVLRTQLERYENAAVSEDARALLARVHGELARRGDSKSARWVYENTAEEAQDQGGDGGDRDQDRDVRTDEAKLAALQALMNMDSERALPILRRVIEDHENDPELRAQAMFILSQQQADGVADLLLEAARSDPDPEVRDQAVFWLSQAESERALPILASILENPDDERLHEQALFAVAQLDDPRGREILRDFARSSTVSPELRKNAIFWLGQGESGETVAFLRELWDSTPDSEVREAILFSMSQMDEGGNAGWLMDIALDESENIEVRKQALFMAGQRDDVDAADLIGVYDRAPDRELKQQALFVLSQSDDPAAFDKMVEVARTEDDPELRTNAIFWIGQSDDPRAEDVLLEILE